MHYKTKTCSYTTPSGLKLASRYLTFFDKRATRIHEFLSNLSLFFEKIACGVAMQSFIIIQKVVEHTSKIQGQIFIWTFFKCSPPSFSHEDDTGDRIWVWDHCSIHSIALYNLHYVYITCKDRNRHTWNKWNITPQATFAYFA